MNVVVAFIRSRAHSVRRRVGDRLARLDRRAAPHWLLLKAMPVAIRRRFDSAAATDLEARFELRIRDPKGREPVRFELVIESGACAIVRGPASNPAATAMLGADDLIRLASGLATWPELLSSGRFELTGDPFVALRFASLFRLPVSLDAP